MLFLKFHLIVFFTPISFLLIDILFANAITSTALINQQAIMTMQNAKPEYYATQLVIYKGKCVGSTLQ